MTAPAPEMVEIMQAIDRLHRGDRDGARTDLLQLWQRWRENGSPLQRCTVAHFLADTEDDVDAELAWDMRALEAATGAEDGEDRDPLDPALAGFLPSLHLNVGDASRRLGDVDRARRHVDYGLAHVASLGEGGYVETIRVGLTRLKARLEEGD